MFIKLLGAIVITIVIIFVLLATATYGYANDNLHKYIGKICKSNCINANTLTDIVLTKVKDNKLDFRLVIAVIKTESGFRLNAKNGSSEGLMQVHKRIHREKLIGKNTFDPTVSISVGTQILNTCYKRKISKGISKVLECYNGGGDPLYAEKVLKTYKRLLAIKTFSTQKFRIFTTEVRLPLKGISYAQNQSLCNWWYRDKFNEYVFERNKIIRPTRNRNVFYRHELFQYNTRYV